jgi:tetratricopeptide (TPR) repeat protein
MTSVDDHEPRIPFGSWAGALVLDRLLRHNLLADGRAVSEEDWWQLLNPALPPEPLPAGYAITDELKDFLAYLDAALDLATRLSCARCDARGMLPEDAIGFIVIAYRRSETDQEAALIIDPAVRAGVIQYGWGMTETGEFLCADHAARKDRKNAQGWSQAWNADLGADIHAGRGIWADDRSWRDTAGGRVTQPRMSSSGGRQVYLRFAAEYEGVLEETTNADDPELVEKNAMQLLTLGGLYVALHDFERAERLVDELADLNRRLDSPVARELAAAASIQLAIMVANDDRHREALTIVEGVVVRCGGFPRFDLIPVNPAAAATLDPGVTGVLLWLSLLEEFEDYERLYEAAGITLPMLNPTGSTNERVVLGKAFVWRARAAEHLGYKDEAVEMYEKGIAQLQGEDPAETEGYLDAAVMMVPALLSELDRHEEASAAYARAAKQFKGDKRPLARVARHTARKMSKLHKR